MAQFHRSLMMLAALGALSACATVPPPGPTPLKAVAETPPPDHSSAYGLYLAGEVAMESNDSHAAADFFGQAKQSNPDASFLKERAFIAALMSGDVSRAAALAPGDGEGEASSQALGALVQAVDALADGDGAKAYARLSAPTSGPPVFGASSLLKPWAAAAADRMSDAVTMPAANDKLLHLIAGLDQAQLFERAHRYDEAETAFKALMSQRAMQPITGPAYGVFLERRGRRKEALAVYDQMIADDPSNASVAAARTRVMSRGSAPAQVTLREGAAQALMVPAGAAVADKQNELGLMYLHLILRLDPNRDDAWMAAGDVMALMSDARSARGAYEQVGPKSPSYVEARSRLAWSYQADDKEAALKIARETAAARPDSIPAQRTLAYLLHADERFDDAIKALGPLIANSKARPDWQLYYMRGVALERTGHWPEAQLDLDKALSVRPDEPQVLNYLGYSWVNRGQRVKDGLALIQKAVDSQPDEGAFVDSLGWAYYRLGDYSQAVTTLEHAVVLDAGDAEINDHLGDAYWRVGRRDEAKFQWSAVLTLNPDPDVKARAESKLASPQGPDGTVATPTVAHP